MERPGDLPAVPDVARYRQGLTDMRVARAVTPQQRLMLLRHFQADGHTVTASELARLVRYPDWNTINLQYGLFAQALADRMRWPVPPDLPAAYTIAWFDKPDGAEEHWRWHMHEELVEAMKQVTW